MNNSHPRPLLPALLAALAFVAINTPAARAQQQHPAAQPTPAAVASSPTPEKGASAAALTMQVSAAESAASAPAAGAKSTTGAPDKCACESGGEPDGSTPSLEPAEAERAQLLASTPAASKPAAPELFPRVTAVRDGQQTGASQQPGATPTPWTPLTPEEKMKRAARNAFLNPLGIGRTLVSSALTQYNEDDQPHKTRGDEFADFGTRFAINFGRRATRTLLGSGVYPVLFKQDPRYDRAEEGKGFAARAGHAVSRVFVQRGDSGNLQPAVSRWAGSLSASALSNIWERSTPGHDRIGADATFKRFANSFVSDSINNLFIEFLPDIKKIFGK